MNSNERNVIAGILLLIAGLVSFDIYKDSLEGVVVWHVLVEGAVAVLALVGVFYLIRGTFTLKHRLQDAEAWRADSKKYVEGLSRAIDQQLTKWNLTAAEKEVAFLLLKGLSLKEIADIRQTGEKTARAQSMAIYAKAGLSGRSELSAFFLEDLLVPQ
jgi:DNA-binding CsgD family transcriptional regulator